MDKKTLRKEMLQKRNMLSREFCIDASLRIYENLLSSKLLNSKNNIFIYSDFKNEVITDDIISYLFMQKRVVYLPKCNTDNHTMTAERIYDNKTDYIKNIYGIDEPVCTDKIDALKPDCAIVPGIAFDVHGNRLGFGAGYYDRYFETAGEITKIALAYDFQILNEIPREDNDISMDAIITEKRIIVL